MSFSENIPSKVLENSYTKEFASLLDSLQNFKSESLFSAIRTNNFALLTDKKWILKRLTDFGLENIPIELPLIVLQQMLLNADSFNRLRGSKIGVQFYCSILSLGEVTIDDSSFFSESKLLILDSLEQSFITEDNSKKIFYLCDDSSLINPAMSLGIEIKSKFFKEEFSAYGNTIKQYIEASIIDYVGFNSNLHIDYTYQERDDFYYHELLNKFFV